MVSTTRDQEWWRVRVDTRGRVVIPAAVRRAFGLQAGDERVARLEAGCVVLETRAAIARQLHDLFARIPPDRSLSEELIAERRAEARREAEEG